MMFSRSGVRSVARVLGSAGFFDKSTNSGLWVSGNYAGNDWEPDDHAGRPLSPRWQKPGHRVSNFTGTALQVARFLGLLAQGRLVDSQASAELIGIMGTPFLREGLNTATPPRSAISASCTSRGTASSRTTAKR